jgi:3-phenylpropionate/trans-cinnamate dioxygenase ferredoxin reductase subunit
MLEDEPMERGFGQEAGRYVRTELESRGVEVVGAAEVSHFTGDGRVTGVVLVDGRDLAADLVVCGTGAVPDVVLARRAGLDIGERGGVLCDARLESRFQGLYVAGDICEYDSVLHGGRARIEHERVAQMQGEHVARNMLGAAATFEEVPYFWTDLADWATLEYVGLGAPWDRELVRRESRNGSFAIDYLANGRLVGVLSANGHDDPDEAAARIKNQDRVEASKT